MKRPNLIVRMLARLVKPVVREALRPDLDRPTRLITALPFDTVAEAQRHAQARRDFIARTMRQMPVNPAEQGQSDAPPLRDPFWGKWAPPAGWGVSGNCRPEAE